MPAIPQTPMLVGYILLLLGYAVIVYNLLTKK